MTESVGNSETKKILIVVDVQNCFLFNEFKRGPGDFLNSSGDEETIKMVKEIGDLYREHKDDGFTIFTRDAHPLNHSSFSSQGGVWPNHCRMDYKCKQINSDTQENPQAKINIQSLFEKYPEKKKKIESIFGENSTIAQEYPIIGNHLSYLFNFDPDLKEVLTDLDTITKKNTISIESLIENPIAATSTVNMEKINYPITEKKYVQLLKGQRCEEDANSAFNYHFGYGSKKNLYDQLIERYSKKSSTGLWEYLIQKFPTQHLEITVCGMVGNVCVIFTVTEGMLMWERVYKEPNRKVKFNFSFNGTIFLPGAFPTGIAIRPDISVFNTNTGSFLQDRINGGILPAPYKATYSQSTQECIIYTQEGTLDKFNILPYKQQGGKKYKKCPKCKKNPYHGGKCFVCGFIPFLGKTKTQNRKRGNGKKTRKNKRRITRRK